MPVKILFADDSAVDRLILKSMLSDYDIVTAGDGAEAMHRIREQSDIKLVILDLNMPAMEGFQVLDALRAEDRLHSMRIIILTSSDEGENEIKGLQLGAVDFIRKPFQRDTLRARVRTHIEMLLIKQELEQKLQTQGLTYELIFEQAPIGIAISFGSDPSDAQQNAHYSINPMYEQITGRSKASLLELGWARITHPDDLAQDLEQYAKLQAGDIDAYSIEKRLIKPDGSIVWVQLSVSALKIANSHQHNHIALLQDITQRKEMEQALRYNNDHDRWTGLYNRSFLERLLAEDADRYSSGKRAVVGINLVEIQSLASRYGFQYTQKLIKKIVAALLAHSTDTRSLFCTYENRFVFYLKNHTGQDELLRFSQEIAATLRTLLIPERIGGGISIVEINQDNAHAVEQLLKDLLIASEYAIRDTEHDLGVCYYDDQLAANFARRQDIEDELIRVAASKADDGLYLHYQPVLDLKTGRICAFEALTRLHSDVLGNLSPAEFIPIAEEAKLILPIGRKIVSQALRFLKRLHESGFESVSVLINISIIQLIDHEFSCNLFQAIRDVHVNPESIGLEITESVFAADFDRINRILGVLNHAGLHVSIDDFGTGYSSFSREQDLNVKSLKIDKSFIDGIMQTDPDKTVIADIIAMAHKFNHLTIAEGVEHEKQLQYLQSCGCDWIQGYLVSKPLDENAALEFLAQYKGR